MPAPDADGIVPRCRRHAPMRMTLADNALELLPERAVWWPQRRTVVVADVHLGKDQVFRRSGVAIPSSVLDAELAALDALIEATGCERLLVLGDWVHAPPAPGDAWPGSIAAWRRRRNELSVELVLGNHDRDLWCWLRDWRIRGIEEPLAIDGLSLFHQVDPSAAEPGMSGHLHPVALLRSGRERLRCPVFARRGDHLVLPAFGRFTGGCDALDPRQWDLYAVAGTRVVDLSPATGRRTGSRRSR